MKLHTGTDGKKDVAFNDITDETIWKLQEMGVKFIDRKNPIHPGGSVTLFPNRPGDTTKRPPETRESPRQTLPDSDSSKPQER